VPERVALENFLKGLLDGSIVSREVLDAQLGGLGSDEFMPSSTEVAKLLVNSKLLTRYQADTLLDGKGRTLEIGQYLVLDRIGSGGMGTVYKAKHRKMNRIVAIKTLTSEASRGPWFRRRFEREMQMIAQLHHPNIVMAFDAGECTVGPYLVMEFVDGEDLATEVETHGPLTIRVAVETLLQAARGLASAHDRGLIHRDVKPANFLRDKSGTVKVADVGIARLAEPEGGDHHHAITSAGDFLGSAAYTAPEQAIDATTVDGRADIYGLGCTLYYLLTGGPPFHARTLMSLLWKHREAPIPSVCEVRLDAPASLDAIFAKMVAKKVEDRFGSMTEVITALEALVRSKSLSDTSPVVVATRQTLDQNESVVTLNSHNETLGLSSDEVSLARLAIEATEPSVVVHNTFFSKLVVVVVEPSRLQAKLVQRYLEELGIRQIHMTRTGQEALKLLKRVTPDIFFSSIQLEDMNGVDFIDALQADPSHNQIGLLLASTSADQSSLSKCSNLSMVRILTKPFTASQLADALSDLMAKRQLLP
jgi:serine/threonine-protein kinase